VKLAFHGEVDERGNLLLDTRGAFVEALKGFVGKPITITLGLKRKPRSGKENNYYWGVVIDRIVLKTGSPADSVHDAMKLKFLLVTDEKLGVTTRSTASLSTVEMEDYLEKIREWALDWLELRIPLPNEVEVPDEVAIIDGVDAAELAA
jgi:hypothetical protein